MKAYVVKIFPSIVKATVMLLKQQLFNSGFSHSDAYHGSWYYFRHDNSLFGVVCGVFFCSNLLVLWKISFTVRWHFKVCILFL